MRPQAPLIVPNEFFRCEPSRPLHIATFDLAYVQGGVQRRAGIMQNIGTQNAVLSGQRVHDHFGHGAALGEIEKRPTMTFDTIPG